MRNIITGRVIAVDHARQGCTIKPDKAQPIHVYADEKVLAKLANKIESGRLAGKKETRGKFIVSGKVLLSYRSNKTSYRRGDIIIESDMGIFSFDRLIGALDRVISRRHLK